jgi:hypothetical protein
MDGPTRLITWGLILAAIVSFDLVRTLRTGRAHGKFDIITRKGNPGRFQRYVYADWLALGLVVGVLVYALVEVLRD